MNAFRALLAVLWVGLVGITAVVVANHGINLFPAFFGEIRDLTWSGQFNADFTCFLVLSGLWLAWRHEFSPTGLVLGVCGFFGGAAFLFPYLLVVSLQSNGNIAQMMLGKRRCNDIGGVGDA